MMLLLLLFRAKMWIYWRRRHVMCPLASLEVSSSEKLSRAATRNLFTWTLSDGIKPEESAMWEHEWLEGLLNEDEEEEEQDAEQVSSD